MLIVILLALCVSFDTLGVAMAYRMAGIHIPNQTRCLIAFLNGALTFTSIWLGRLLCPQIPAVVFRSVSAAILIVLGIKTLWNALGENKTTDYDRDDSRIIDLCEGCTIGVVFAFDSISAVFGILNLGKEIYFFPFATALFCFVFLFVGGLHFYNLRKLNGISGLILIVFGVLRLFFDFF